MEGNESMATLEKSIGRDTTPAEQLTKEAGETEVTRIAIAFIITSVAIATVLLATAVILYLKYR